MFRSLINHFEIEGSISTTYVELVPYRAGGGSVGVPLYVRTDPTTFASYTFGVKSAAAGNDTYPIFQVLDSSANGNFTVSGLGAVNSSANGAASTPATLLRGTWFTGGTSTTTKPQLLIEPTGTTSTGWSTAGTGLGINAASSFTGNLFDCKLNGVSTIWGNYQGSLYVKNIIGNNTGTNSFQGFALTSNNHIDVYTGNGSLNHSFLGANATLNAINTGGFSWTSGGDPTASPDTKLMRDAAGVVKATDGSGNIASLKGKITTHTAYTATPQTSTGYLTMYDSSGTAYKVLVST